MPRTFIRRLRHWRQRFNPNAEFIFARYMLYNGKQYKAGDPVPEHLIGRPGKLREFWGSKAIELAEFTERDVRTGEVKWKSASEATKRSYDDEQIWANNVPKGVSAYKLKGGWYQIVLEDGRSTKVQGVDALNKLLDKLSAAAKAAPKPKPKPKPKAAPKPKPKRKPLPALFGGPGGGAKADPKPEPEPKPAPKPKPKRKPLPPLLGGKG